MRWAREEQDDKARKLYLYALSQDTDNRGARFNLGALDTEAGKYDRAIDRLEMAMGNEPKDLVWYKAAYQLAATYHYQSMREEDEAEKLWRQAKSEGIKVLYSLRSKQKALKACQKKDEAENWQKLAESEAKKLCKAIEEAANPQKNENKELRKFLESFKPMATIMYAEILADNKEEKKADLILESIDSTKLNYRGHYNLACYYSIICKNKVGNAQAITYEHALHHLEYALERGGDIVKWAQEDPSLNRLREDKKGDFDDCIKKYSAPVTPSTDLLPLAGLRAIGETYAKQLKEQGIVSHDDLILKAKDCYARKELAEKLCINDKFLQRWALLADMMRIVGIDTQYANLLEAAGVRSLDDLKVRDSQELTKLLHQVNSAQSLVKQLPVEEKVQQWVRDALKTTKPIVSG